jgi:hypothetical protein
MARPTKRTPDRRATLLRALRYGERYNMAAPARELLDLARMVRWVAHHCSSVTHGALQAGTHARFRSSRGWATTRRLPLSRDLDRDTTTAAGHLRDAGTRFRTTRGKRTYMPSMNPA